MKRNQVHGTAKLIISIDGDLYVLRRLECDPPVRVAWRVARSKKRTYDVHRDPVGVYCTCADFTFRQRECKHIRALTVAGLLGGDWIAGGKLDTKGASHVERNARHRADRS